MTVNYKGHDIIGTTNYGDIRCTTCEHNRNCYNSSSVCIKDWETEAQLFEDVDMLKKKLDEILKENQSIKEELAKYKLMSLF